MGTTPTTGQIEAGTKRIDDALVALDQGNKQEVELLQEHLKSIRTYLLGGMPVEGAAAFEMARKSAAGISDPELRGRSIKALDDLRENLAGLGGKQAVNFAHRPAHHRALGGKPRLEKSRLWNFFEGTPTRLGTFYPTSFVSAILPDLDAAEGALRALRTAGVGEDDALAVSGAEMLAFLDELRNERGILGEFMAHLSRTFGTEQIFADFDLRLAREGAGFLMVYCPEDDEAIRIKQILEPFHTISMQRYLAGAVETMVSTPKSSGPEL